jgi:hypothetical protein
LVSAVVAVFTLIFGLAAALLLAAAVIADLVQRRRHLGAVLACRAERDHSRTGPRCAWAAPGRDRAAWPRHALLGHADRLGPDDASWQTGSTIGAIARQISTWPMV